MGPGHLDWLCNGRSDSVQRGQGLDQQSIWFENMTKCCRSLKTPILSCSCVHCVLFPTGHHPTLPISHRLQEQEVGRGTLHQVQSIYYSLLHITTRTFLFHRPVFNSFRYNCSTGEKDACADTQLLRSHFKRLTKLDYDVSNVQYTVGIL